MKLEKYIYTIRHLLKSVNKDSRINDRMLIDFINRYREYNIKQYWDANKEIKPQWFTNLGVVELDIVNSADDPNVQYTSIAMGKYKLPKVVSIPRMNTINIRSTSRHQKISLIDQDILYKLIETEDEFLREYTTYHFQGDVIYFYPLLKNIFVSALLADPLEGISYTELYDPEGNLISAADTKRNLTILDEYPVDGELGTMIILDILTKEFQIERQQIADINVDAAETDELMKGRI